MRWMHRIYAAMFGYFWLECVLCERSFGGHEWRDYGGKPATVNGRAICPKCTREGRGDVYTQVLRVPSRSLPFSITSRVDECAVCAGLTAQEMFEQLHFYGSLSVCVDHAGPMFDAMAERGE